MKKIFTLALFFLTAGICFSQSPQAFNYSAVVRNGSGTPIPNQNVNFRFSILSGSMTGPSVYSETQATTTDANGVVNLEIGRGSIVSGSFSSIEWGNNSFFLQVEIDITGGSSFQMMGTTQFISVPYAMYARYAGSSGSINSSLDTIADLTAYDNHYTSVTAVNFINGEFFTADQNENVIVGEYANVASYQSNGTINFSLSFDPAFGSHIYQIFTDYANNIYAPGIAYNQSVTINNTVYNLNGNCGPPQIYILKADASGNVLWAKPFDQACSGYSVDVDSAGNIYLFVSGKVIKYNANGDSVSTISIPDTDYQISKVNNNGDFIIGYSGALYKYYTNTGVLKWSKNILGFYEPNFFVEPDGSAYFLSCNEGCFAIGNKQYCENADKTVTTKLIKLDNSGNLVSYTRYNNSPTISDCWGRELFKIQGNLATLSYINGPFKNNGITYPTGYYLVKF